MLKSREGKQPPANYYAAILGYLIRAYPDAELTPSLLAQLKPAWDQMWLMGRPAEVVAKTTCSCDGKHITLSPVLPYQLPRGAVRAPAGTPRGSVVMPSALRESAGLLRARSQVKRTERMFEKAAVVRSGSSWSQQAVLLPPERVETNVFGTAMALRGDVLVIADPLANTPVTAAQSQVLLYTRCGSSWSQPGQLLASDRKVHDSFGAAVAWSGDSVLIGATGADPGQVYMCTVEQLKRCP